LLSPPMVLRTAFCFFAFFFTLPGPARPGAISYQVRVLQEGRGGAACVLEQEHAAGALAEGGST
jgi:hypothetical protein